MPGVFLQSVDRFNEDSKQQVMVNRSSAEPSLEAEKVQQTNKASAEA